MAGEAAALAAMGAGGGQAPSIKVPKVGLYGGIIFLVLVLVTVAYFIGRWLGKQLPPPTIPVPPDLNSSGTVSAASDYNPESLTDRLYKDIDGFSFNRDYDSWKELAGLSDTNFVKVMNDWDKRYFSKWKETLYKAYNNEWMLRDIPINVVDLLRPSTSIWKVLDEKFKRLEKLRSK